MPTLLSAICTPPFLCIALLCSVAYRTSCIRKYFLSYTFCFRDVFICAYGNITGISPASAAFTSFGTLLIVSCFGIISHVEIGDPYFHCLNLDALCLDVFLKTPTELFDMPANLFVAQFVGAPMMNTVKCDLIKEGDKYFVNPYGFKLPVDGPKAKALLDRGIESRPIILGVRPEHIQLAKGKESIPTTIQVNEMMGSEYHLHVTTDAGDRLIVRIPTLSLSDEERAAMIMGNPLNIGFSGKAMHFFDPESEKNLLVDITNADAYELDADIIHKEEQEELPKADKEA